MSIHTLILQIRRNLFVHLFVVALSMPSFGQIGIFSTSHETVSKERIGTFTITTWRVFSLYLGDMDYLFVYSSGAYDTMMTGTISFGTFSKTDNGFVLNDQINGYAMEVEYVNDSSLVFTKGPYCMKNRTLILKPWNQSFYDSEYKPTEYDYQQVEKMRQNYSCQQELSYSIIGDYNYGTIFEDDFSPLTFQEDGSYELRYRSGEILLSKGKWSRQGNLILLQDDFMDEPFYAFVEKDSILIRFFVGDWTRLYKKN